MTNLLQRKTHFFVQFVIAKFIQKNVFKGTNDYAEAKDTLDTNAMIAINLLIVKIILPMK